MQINPSHPRATSLAIREKLLKGLKKGITSENGLLAHGRGEAFDYLIGEETTTSSKKAIQVAAAYLLTAKHPVLSVNGNVAALCAKEYVQLSNFLKAPLEVNLFHFTQERVVAIEHYLQSFHPHYLLKQSASRKVKIKTIKSPRQVVLQDGIAKADVVLVPLEDGDRTEVLVSMGKKVITIDLNPLSRTASKATVTVIDHINRVLPLLEREIKKLQRCEKKEMIKIIRGYKNQEVIQSALETISVRLLKLARRTSHDKIHV